MPAKHTPITLTFRTVDLKDIDKVDRDRILAARKRLAFQVGKIVHEKLTGVTDAEPQTITKGTRK